MDFSQRMDWAQFRDWCAENPDRIVYRACANGVHQIKVSELEEHTLYWTTPVRIYRIYDHNGNRLAVPIYSLIRNLYMDEKDAIHAAAIKKLKSPRSLPK